MHGSSCAWIQPPSSPSICHQLLTRWVGRPRLPGNCHSPCSEDGASDLQDTSWDANIMKQIVLAKLFHSKHSFQTIHLMNWGTVEGVPQQPPPPIAQCLQVGIHINITSNFTLLLYQTSRQTICKTWLVFSMILKDYTIHHLWAIFPLVQTLALGYNFLFFYLVCAEMPAITARQVVVFVSQQTVKMLRRVLFRRQF